jgi:hypothetical protein
LPAKSPLSRRRKDMQVVGRVRVILPHRLIREGDKRPLRLTTIAEQAAMDPEAHEVDLAPFGGQKIEVGCQSVSGDWVYDAGEIRVLEG